MPNTTTTTTSTLDQRRRETAERQQRHAHVPAPSWAGALELGRALLSVASKVAALEAGR